MIDRRGRLGSLLVAFAVSTSHVEVAYGTQGQVPKRAIEELSIGAIDGPPAYVFARIADLVVDGDGVIYVLDQMEMVVKVFDPAGRHLRSIGGSGSGPGEFREPMAIALVGDTLAVYDTRLKRLTLFTRDGSVVETRRIALPFLWGTGLAALGRGEFLLALEAGYSIPPRPALEGRWWLVRLGADGSVRDTLVAMPGADVLLYRTTDWIEAIPAPFQRGPAWAVAADGRIAFGRGVSYRIPISRYGGDDLASDRSTSGPLMMVYGEQANPVVTDADVRRYRSSYRSRYSDRPDLHERRRRRYEQLLADADYPETWPAYVRLRFDDRGRLWVQRRDFVHDRGAGVWHVYGPTGEREAEVEVPGRSKVYAISGPFVYGVVEDDLGVQYVKRYRVAPPP